MIITITLSVKNKDLPSLRLPPALSDHQDHQGHQDHQDRQGHQDLLSSPPDKAHTPPDLDHHHRCLASAGPL